jgi:hypothetical protein
MICVSNIQITYLIPVIDIVNIVSSALQTMLDTAPIYKGKITHRSWGAIAPRNYQVCRIGIGTPHLAVLTSQSNLNRLVTTHYILDVCATTYLPHSCNMWHPRLIYTILRDAIDIEELMCICPAWGTAHK